MASSRGGCDAPTAARSLASVRQLVSRRRLWLFRRSRGGDGGGTRRSARRPAGVAGRLSGRGRGTDGWSGLAWGVVRVRATRLARALRARRPGHGDATGVGDTSLEPRDGAPAGHDVERSASHSTTGTRARSGPPPTSRSRSAHRIRVRVRVGRRRIAGGRCGLRVHPAGVGDVGRVAVDADRPDRCPHTAGQNARTRADGRRGHDGPRSTRIVYTGDGHLGDGAAVPAFEAVPVMSTGPVRIGIGGPVGSGKTALVDALCKTMRERYRLGVITNDIFTREDMEFLVRSQALPDDRIIGVQTGRCPHTAIREDASMNFDALDELSKRHPDLDIVFLESGGDNLAASFSPELVDASIYVIDVSGGDKIPRKGGPGVTRSDLLVINKIDLAPHVGASLDVMSRDARLMRGERPFVFTNLKSGAGLEEVVTWIRRELLYEHPVFA